MPRIKNFAHIPVGDETKKEIDDLKNQLNEKFPGATYDELIQIFLVKHKNLIIADNDLKKVILKKRGIKI